VTQNGVAVFYNQVFSRAHLIGSDNKVSTVSFLTQGIPAADGINQPLLLNNIGASEFTFGNGVIRVELQYRIVDFSTM
jgi:hypothetical protein